MPPIDPQTIADSAAVIKQAMETLRAELAAAEAKATALRNQKTALRKASIPPSDVIQFLKDYIDVKAGEYLAGLNHEIDNLVFPNRGTEMVPRDHREPLSFGEYESLLTPDGEVLFGNKLYANSVMFDGGPAPKYKMLGLLTSIGDFGQGRAFCFFFGEEMKRALDANADKIVILPILASKMHESTRAQRRVMLDDLEKKIKEAEQEACAIHSQLKAIGVNMNVNNEVKYVIR